MDFILNLISYTCWGCGRKITDYRNIFLKKEKCVRCTNPKKICGDCTHKYIVRNFDKNSCLVLCPIHGGANGRDGRRSTRLPKPTIPISISKKSVTRDSGIFDESEMKIREIVSI